MNSIQNDLIWKKNIYRDASALKILAADNFRLLFNYGIKINTEKEFVKQTIQQLFVDAWLQRDFLQNSINAKAYLIAALRRALCIRIDNFELAGEDNGSMNFELEMLTNQNEVYNKSYKFIIAKIAKYINLISYQQKEVFYLKFTLNLAPGDIAYVMNISLQTVSAMFNMMMENLKEQVEKSN